MSAPLVVSRADVTLTPTEGPAETLKGVNVRIRAGRLTLTTRNGRVVLDTLAATAQRTGRKEWTVDWPAGHLDVVKDCGCRS